MNKVKESLKKIIISTYFPFLILFFVQFFLNLQKTIGYRDDIWFKTVLVDYKLNGIFEYLKWRYNLWTSRYILELILMFLIRIDYIVWKLVDAIFLSMLGIAILKFCRFQKLEKKEECKISWIICLCLMNMPHDLFSGAGWIATFSNYLFPITMGTITLIPLKKYLNNEKIKKFEKILYCVTGLIASNMEQMCIVLIVSYILFILYSFKKKIKCDYIIYILFLIMIIGIFNIIICPGNLVRLKEETSKFYITFNSLTIIDKIALGIISIVDFCMVKFNMIYIVFSLTVMIAMLKIYKNIFLRLISIIPFIFGILNCVGFFYINFNLIFFNIQENNLMVMYNKIMPLQNISALIVFFITIFCLSISLILIFKDKLLSCFSLLIFYAGICSKMVMGFSPTIWASEDRTSFLLIISMIINIVLIARKKEKLGINAFLIILSVGAFFNTIEKLIVSIYF